MNTAYNRRYQDTVQKMKMRLWICCMKKPYVKLQ